MRAAFSHFSHTESFPFYVNASERRAAWARDEVSFRYAAREPLWKFGGFERAGRACVFNYALIMYTTAAATQGNILSGVSLGARFYTCGSGIVSA